MAKGPPTTEPSAGAPAPPSTPELEADAQDDSITATAPAPRVTPSQAASTGVTVPLPPLSVPGAVKIRTLGVDDADDPMDETEVRTLVTQPSEAVATALANATKPLPAAGRPPPSAGPPTSSSPSPTVASARAEDVGEADEPDDSVTTQAPSPLSRIPTDDEPKTSPPMKLSPAGVRPQAASTTQEQAAPDEDDEPKTSPPLAAPIPAAGRRPSDPGDFYANSDDSEDSVTTRGPALNPEEYEDDSVTAQGPVTRAPTQQSPALLAALELPPSLEEGTEGTTKKVAKRNQIIPKTLLSPAAPEELPADTEKGSITAEAPGPLTNMLRVIATPGDDSGSGAIVKDDDLEEENKTAVMLGAPVKPGAPAGSSRGLRAATQLSSGSGGGGGARAAAIADLREPSSDSGLRVARAEEPSGDHASLDALFGVNGAKHDSGVGPALVDHGSANMKSRDGSPSPFANTEKAFPPMNMPGSASHIPVPGNGAAALDARASAHNLDFAATLKKPRYGLLVGFVAVLSITIPLVLFLWLKSAGENAMARTPSEVVSDPVPRGDPARAKGKPGASGAPSGSHSGRGGGSSGGGGWSIRRH